MGLYFLASLPKGSELCERDRPWERLEDNGVKLIFEWFDLGALTGMRVNPSFLVQGLAALPEGVEHVVQRD